MSRGELLRVSVFSRIASGELKLIPAAEMLARIYRQIKRL
jgi:hypothetical protein